jgi:hypothetical protein
LFDATGAVPHTQFLMKPAAQFIKDRKNALAIPDRIDPEF